MINPCKRGGASPAFGTSRLASRLPSASSVAEARRRQEEAGEEARGQEARGEEDHRQEAGGGQEEVPGQEAGGGQEVPGQEEARGGQEEVPGEEARGQEDHQEEVGQEEVDKLWLARGGQLLSLGMMISCDCPEFSGGCTLMAASLFCAWGMGLNPHACASSADVCSVSSIPVVGVVFRHNKACVHMCVVRIQKGHRVR